MKLLCMAILAFFTTLNFAKADEVGCVSTTFNLLSPNDKVCVSDFEDQRVPGVVCHISQARKGGKLPANEEAFSERTSIFFKATRIYRMIDKKHNTLIYLAVSSKIVNGSPANAISTVPIMPWATK